HPIVIVNITDIDPKISSKAKLENISQRKLSTKYLEELLIDLSSLGINGTLNFARASDYVESSKEIVKKLLRKNIAYSTSGNMFLDTTRLSSYGKLSGMTRQELDNARLDISPGKRNPSDILLWNTVDDLDEKYSDEILGNGIPWWHLQDSSIAISNFNGHYDIHGGAVDLIYPHHESHRAQLQVLTSCERPVKYWTHVGLLTLGSEKMSKTLHNTIRIRDLLKKYKSNIIRLYIFSHHYRSNFDFSLSMLDKFREVDETIANAFIRSEKANAEFYHCHHKDNTTKKYLDKFIKCIEDDFDTPKALDVLAHTAKSNKSFAALRDMVSIFGLRY
ncbi:MAG TPA: class I tRNA ligase family protein, partial [Nitrososphaeraceae archaeon]|nr:class I tRNA ligase family protein [Nitrososphaeraceae archaeon]